MYNYYEYCKNISKSYYPKIYNDINRHVETILRETDSEQLHPFPTMNVFEQLVEAIFKRYKKEIYKDMIEGKISGANYSDSDVINETKDFIKVLLIQRIITSRERFRYYSYYY